MTHTYAYVCVYYASLIQQYVSRAESSCISAMIDALAMSTSPVKSQQIGDAELTPEQRREELLHQYTSRPLVFLERYHVRVHSSVCSFDHMVKPNFFRY